jgi:hypothetical protein
MKTTRKENFKALATTKAKTMKSLSTFTMQLPLLKRLIQAKENARHTRHKRRKMHMNCTATIRRSRRTTKRMRKR